MSMRAPLRITALVMLWACAAPGRACSTCFGDADDPQTKGIQAAIIVLLVITYLMLGAILVFFIRMIRRGARLANQNTPESNQLGGHHV